MVSLDAEILERGESFDGTYKIGNHHLTVGARIAGQIARVRGNAGPAKPMRLRFSGSAGQSFGAFTLPNMQLHLEGEANDHVGKGLCGGEIVIRPFRGAAYAADGTPHVLLGNTALYGATAGSLFAAGSAGDRFAVRNSGAVAVIEGAGDHCCEYMTGGVVVVLGYTGRNFAAGMSGGIAYVLDEDGSFPRRCNLSMVELEPVMEEEEMIARHYHQAGDLDMHGRVDVMADMTRFDAERLRQLIDNHARYTGSRRAQEILGQWAAYLPKFRKVMPVEYRRALAELKAREAGADQLPLAAAGG